MSENTWLIFFAEYSAENARGATNKPIFHQNAEALDKTVSL